MKANYHTHTPRCRHASGKEEEFIEKAIIGCDAHRPSELADPKNLAQGAVFALQTK